MTGREFIRRMRKLGKTRKMVVRFDESLGKGSHGTLYFGTAKCTVKDRRKELGEGLLNAMLAQLGLSKIDIGF